MVVDIIINVLEFLSLFILMETIMTRKSNLSLMWFILADIVNTYVLTYIITPYFTNKLIRGILLFAVCYAISYIAYRDPPLKRLFAIAIYFSLIYILDLFFASLVFLQFDMTIIELAASNIYGAVAILSKILLVLISVILSWFWKNNKLVSYFTTNSYIVALIPIILIMIINFQTYQNIYNGEMNLLILLILISSFALVFYQMVVLYREKQTAIAEIEKQILRNQNKIHMQNIRYLTESYSAQRQLTHDFNNEIACILELIETENYKKATEYIKTLQKQSSQSSTKYKTGNPLVDAILNTKRLECHHNNIRMRVVFTDLSKMVLEDEDIVTVLGNLLNNAEEACLRLPTDKRVIIIKINSEPSQDLIIINNPVAEPVTIKDNTIETNKDDSLAHGYGLRNVQYALGKYSHEYDISCVNNQFITIIKVFCRSIS